MGLTGIFKCSAFIYLFVLVSPGCGSPWIRKEVLCVTYCSRLYPFLKHANLKNGLRFHWPVKQTLTRSETTSSKNFTWAGVATTFSETFTRACSSFSNFYIFFELRETFVDMVNWDPSSSSFSFSDLFEFIQLFSCFGIAGRPLAKRWWLKFVRWNALMC